MNTRYDWYIGLDDRQAEEELASLRYRHRIYSIKMFIAGFTACASMGILVFMTTSRDPLSINVLNYAILIGAGGLILFVTYQFRRGANAAYSKTVEKLRRRHEMAYYR
ncbi:hypothetical protein [Mycobacterium sp. 1245805.9]|uniref:hypothetical protein n=1 Tax=Mycobacterium sp. 1245805.9 TaxID=1856862 RepID=UPI0012E9A51E|nr:hypothetical protein [Mycobacterium sp. 1245805.9]